MAHNNNNTSSLWIFSLLTVVFARSITSSRVCPYPIRLKIPVMFGERKDYVTLKFTDCDAGSVEETCRTHLSSSQDAVSYVSEYVISGFREHRETMNRSPSLDYIRVGKEYVKLYENCEASWGSVLEHFMNRAPRKGVLDVDQLKYTRQIVVDSCEKSRYCNGHQPSRSARWYENLAKTKDMYVKFAEDLRAVKDRAMSYCDDIFNRKTGKTYSQCRPENNQDNFHDLCHVREIDLDDNTGSGGKQAHQSHYCQLSDIEAEMTYLRIRALRPRRVFELSPFHGYSTFWILSALRDNGFGTLHSFDITDNVVKHGHIPQELIYSQGQNRRWFFTQGDAREVLRNLSDEEVNFDYLFIDSLHTAEFAKMYLTDVFSRQSSSDILHASFHDCYMNRCGATREECTEVLNWLRDHGHSTEDEVFSASLRGNFDFYQSVMQTRWDLGISAGLDDDFNANNANSMMFIN